MYQNFLSKGNGSIESLKGDHNDLEYKIKQMLSENVKTISRIF